MATGTVLSLHRYPVKSMGGEAVEALEVDEHGARHDRKHAVWLRGGRKLTARVAPRMLAWHASPNGAGGPHVVAPDGREFTWGKELEAAIGEHLGKDVALVQDPQGLADVSGLHVTFEASRQALEEELGMPVDLRRFRPNIHVALDAEPFAESEWEGRTLRVGDAELHVASAADRCAITIHDPDTLEKAPDVLRTINERHGTFFGLWVDARGPARIAVGDRVELL
ncbi:MAG: MOSC domain-containing protein [Actinomycetota bacterium]|nr:MOSC domain-containing protein [Actinomycetota bacterium]